MPTSMPVERPVRSLVSAMLFTAIGAALIAGSVQAKSSVKGTWAEGAPRDRSFTRVLVVASAPA